MTTRIPSLLDDYPSLMPLYPWSIENDFELTWQSQFCNDTMILCLVLCVIYCSACFLGNRFMQTRKPFDLIVPLRLWNLLLAGFSCIGALRTVPFLLNSIQKYGLYHSICTDATIHYGNGSVGLWVALFIFSKIPELIDTFFIVVRKKPLIFLHWYHHITVLLYCWHSYSVRSSNGLYFVAINYSVHAVMYFYYFLTACGLRPRWALLVTIMQLSQMVIGILVTSLSYFYLSSGLSCSVNETNLQYGILMYASYFLLFLRFFLQRYMNQSIKAKTC